MSVMDEQHYGPVTSHVELDAAEEAIILKMFKFMYGQATEHGVEVSALLDCDQQTFDDLWGSMKQ